MTSTNRLENGDSREYWTGAKDGRLLFQRCSDCDHVQFPPRHICTNCWSDQLEATESSGYGTIESLTIVRRAPMPAYRGQVPYVVAAVATAEGPRMITNILGEGALEAKPGDDVVVDFVPGDQGATLPQFRLVAASAGR